MIELVTPNPIYGDLLEEELSDAGLVTTVRVNGDLGEILILDGLDESDRDAAQAVVDNHAMTAQVQIQDLQVEQTNKTQIETDARNATTSNRNDISANDAWLTTYQTTNPTQAQLLAQVKELTRQSTRQARVLNGIIRMLFEDYTGTS